MKILWLYRYLKYYNKDERLHADFAKAVSQYPGIELKIYAPYIEDIYPELMIMPFKYGRTLQKDIFKEFKPDVMILNCKSRMFWDYNPFASHPGNEWLPCDWHIKEIPTIIIEEDYFYEKNDNWYYNGNVDLILQRHYSQSKRTERVKQMWFPFSVDIDIFKPNPKIKRKNKICFVGACSSDVYVHRKRAIKELRKYDLIDVFDNDEKINGDYIRCLQEYVCHLNGTLKFNTTPAKIFEIVASGSVLLNNREDNGLDKLFKGGYVPFGDEKNLIENAKIILNDKNSARIISEQGLQQIRTKHTHQIRIQQLLNILRKEFNLK